MHRISASQNTSASCILGKAESSLADDITDEPGATNFSHSLAVAQDVEDAMEAFIHFELSELFDIGLHDKEFTWKTNNEA